MRLKDRLAAFFALADTLNKILEEKNNARYHWFNDTVDKAMLDNPWFTKDAIYSALQGGAVLLDKEKLASWASNYTFSEQPKSVACILAGNIPMVGFHDMLCVLLSGHNFIGKTSSKDKQLLPALGQLLIEIEPKFEERIHFVEDLKNNTYDAVIATGSNNTSRYFQQYFGHLPHIIRKGRSSVAILSGNEIEADLKGLADDVFMYFGLGCRNVSKIYLPKGKDIREILPYFNKYIDYQNHNKWMNNYNYNRSINFVNQQQFYETEFALFQENRSFVSPIAVVYYEEYNSLSELLMLLEANREQLQCIVCNEKGTNFVPLGKAQFPAVGDYADNIDTLDFLCNI